MSIELEHAPACCRNAMERIRQILDTGHCLAEVLAVAPALTRPGPARVSPAGLLWRLGSGTASYVQARHRTHQLVNAIIRSRVYTVIDLEIVNHASERRSDLEAHWTRLRQAF